MPEEIRQLKNKITNLEAIINTFLYSDRFIFHRHLQIGQGINIELDTRTGTRIGTATGQLLGFFNVTPAIQQTSGANLTNNVTAGGTNDTIANYTDLSVYANDAAAIRNDIYQLSRKLKQVNDGLRTLGLLS